MHKKRENDLKAASKAAKSETKAETNGHAERPAAPEPEKTQQPAKQPSPTARMLAIKEQMEGHGGAPNARNAPTDAADRSLAQSEYRVLKRTYEDLRAEVGGVSKKKPQHQATA
jgi:hypothetical protein